MCGYALGGGGQDLRQIYQLDDVRCIVGWQGLSGLAFVGRISVTYGHESTGHGKPSEILFNRLCGISQNWVLVRLRSAHCSI